MPMITVTAPSDPNEEIEILLINGRPLPGTFDENTIRNIPNLKLRDDDVMICGYMRAGTHWSFEIINMLLTGVIETVPERKESLHLEQASQEKIDTFSSPRVLSSHLFFEELPREVIDRKTKIVYLVRDPRDSLTSWYTCIQKIVRASLPNWNMSFSDWLELSNNSKLEWGSWFENMESWERALSDHPEHPIIVMYYEDLIQDPIGEISKLKTFLGVDRNEEFCKKVAEKTQFQKMIKDKNDYTERFAGQAVHYNKGIIGNWKTMFTVSMSEEFDQLYETKMSGSQFRNRYSRSGAKCSKETKM